MYLFGKRSMTALYFFSRSYCSLCRVIQSTVTSNSLNFQVWKTNKYFSRLSSSFAVQKEAVTMKLESEDFKKMFTPELEKLASIFNKHGYEIRIAGGAVRDLLMNKVPKDLDFATVATPDQMKEMFIKEEIRMINMKGETHGTVTARINDKENFEVTTLRIDTNTDGRHCEVQFTTDWYIDSGRRDLTINSMFLGLDGTVYDYFNGYEDLKKRRVVFVGNPADRIKEDYLRILRYFRFYGRIAENPDSHDPETLLAIEENAKGLSQISGERIWSELSKTLEGNYGRELLRLITKLGLSPYIGLPEKPNIEQYDKLCSDIDRPLLPISLVVGLLNTEEEMLELNKRLKMSAFCRDLGLFLVNNRRIVLPSEKPLLTFQKELMFTKFKYKDVKTWIGQTLRYRGLYNLEDEMAEWNVPRFPVNGIMLRDCGVEGKLMAPVLRGLKNYWAEHDFNVEADDLLKLVPDLLLEAKNTPSKTKVKK